MPSNHGSGSAWNREIQKYHKLLDEKELDNRRKLAETEHRSDLGGGRRSGGQHESPRPQYGDPPHGKRSLPPREKEHFYDPRDYDVPAVEPWNLPPGGGPRYGYPYGLPQHQYSHPHGGQPSGGEEHFYDPRDYEVPAVEPRDLPPGGGPRYGGRDELPRRQVGDNPQREGTWSQSVHHHPEMPERRPTNVAAGHYEPPLPPVRYKVHWDGPPSPRRPPPGQ